jgi:hypothetical protein
MSPVTTPTMTVTVSVKIHTTPPSSASARRGMPPGSAALNARNMP